jgi:hypothetical protein
VYVCNCASATATCTSTQSGNTLTPTNVNANNTNAIVTQPLAGSSSSKKLPPVAIAFIVIAVIAIIAVLGGVAFVVLRGRKRAVTVA